MEHPTYTAFGAQKLVARGAIAEIIPHLQSWNAQGGEPILVFEDASGKQLDLDLRGTLEDALARLAQHPHFQVTQEQQAPRTGPGRPRLGVVPREVTLLPRHWDWLAEQPGGASVTLRKLCEEALRANGASERARRAREAAEKFMWSMAGNCPDFEEATRALARADYVRADSLITGWPPDIQDHVRRLLAVAQQLEAQVPRDA